MSTTGAHELGHMLGMKHAPNGIMSKSQDGKRSDEVTKINIEQMMTSKMGHRKDIISWIYEKFK